MTDETTRLNKHLALQLGVSRREADNLIAKGVVKINDEIASLGSRISKNDMVSVHGAVVASDTELKYVALHKPAGYVCSRKAQGDAPTVYDLLPQELHELKLVGRLDKDSSGLILLTNDGDFALHMTHPRYQKTKIYEVALNRDLEPLHQQMIFDYGVQLEDGVSSFGLARINDESREDWTVTMHEGRNRQIRRTFAALGYGVTKLHRTTFGLYQLGDLEEGSYTTVTKA